MTDITVVGAGGEYMESVVVVEWHKELGENVTAGELLVTVETAKAATEIEASTTGVLAEIRVPVGEEVPVGAVLGVIEDGAISQVTPRPVAEPHPNEASIEEPSASMKVPARKDSGRILASPLARRIASQNGIDLSKIRPSSQSGRIRLRDLEGLTKEPKPMLAPPTAAASLNITRRGSRNGETVVFLHGFGADSFSWQQLLAAMGNSYNFILVDLPAHGLSPRPSAAGGVDSIAAFVAQSLSTAGVKDFHLVGHSLGGAVSLSLAMRGDLSVRSLTLIAPAGLGPEINGAFLAGFSRAEREESLTPWLSKLFVDQAIVSPSYVSAAVRARSDAGLREAQQTLASEIFPDGTQVTDLRHFVQETLIPQKIIWGEEDQIIPKQHALDTGGNAALHFIPNVGHMPQVEAAATVARLLLQNMRSAS